VSKIRLKLNADEVAQIFPRKLSKSELRRLQIVENVIRISAKSGVEGLAYEKIAKSCGVSRHLVMHYFPSRADMIAQAAEVVWASLKREILESMDRETSATLKLKRYLSANLTWAREYREHAAFLVLIIQHATTHARFKKLFTELMRLGHGRIIGVLQQGVRDGEFRKSIHVDLVSKSIQLTVLGHFVGLVAEDGPYPAAALEEELCRTVVEPLIRLG